MNRISLAYLTLFVLLGTACTTLEPTEASPDEIQRLIVAEGLLAPGDRVKLVTADESVHEFRILEVDLDAGLVNGKNDTVRISEIVAVETRDFAFGNTLLLAAGAPAGVFLALMLAAGWSISLF